MRTVLVAVLVFVPMIVEAVLASRNERAQFARGGVEPARDVYRIMRVAYPALFAAMIAEGASRGNERDGWFAVGASCFAAGKILKWWAIATLGSAWTFRVVVVPGARLISTGPYRFLRHPNYIGVLLEFVGVAAMTHAYVSGPLAVVLFSILMSMRISVENRALDGRVR